MRQKPGPEKAPAEQIVKDIRRATRRHFSAEEKIRVVLEGLRGKESIAELCRREGIASSMYYGWSKEFLEAGKKRLAGDTTRAATSDEVRGLRGSVRLIAATATRVQAPTAAELGAANREHWRSLRQRLERGRQARTLRTRFRHDPATYLAALEFLACQLALPS